MGGSAGGMHPAGDRTGCLAAGLQVGLLSGLQGLHLPCHTLLCSVLPLQLFSQETVMKFVPRYSLVLELSDSGAFLRSLHDPEGQVVTYVSEAHEHSGHLYLGSFRAPDLCRLRL